MEEPENETSTEGLFLEANVEITSASESEDVVLMQYGEGFDDPLDLDVSASKYSPQFLDEEYLQNDDSWSANSSNESVGMQSAGSSAGRKVGICAESFTSMIVSLNLGLNSYSV